MRPQAPLRVITTSLHCTGALYATVQDEKPGTVKPGLYRR